MPGLRLAAAAARWLPRIAFAVLAAAALATQLEARVVRITIDRRESPAFGGRAFTDGVRYEKIIGRATGELDPADPRNKLITDIQLAPRNARGMVEYETDFYLLKPMEAAPVPVGSDITFKPRDTNGLLFYHVANRGAKDDPVHFGMKGGNELADPGDALLYRRGYMFLWAGWQADQLPGNGAMTIRVPVARNADGSELTGRTRLEFITNEPVASLHMYNRFGTNFAGYDTASLDNSTATLTRRTHERDPRREVPRNDWAFADCSNTPFPGKPAARELCLRGGFRPDEIYELTYTAKNPTVQGIGFAATRDVISFFRAAQRDDAGTPNPIYGKVRAVVMRGVSQSGRFMRSFLDFGFNEDEQGRRVVDGMHVHVASQRMPMNVRWAQPGRGGSLQYEEHTSATADAPFTWAPLKDRFTGRTAGLLDRCTATKTCPKIIQTVSGIEYWQSGMALNTTDGRGRQDVAMLDNVRLYYLSSTQHGPATKPELGICQQLSNPAPHRETLRALTVALEEWVLRGTEPPASRFPRISDGTLVLPKEVMRTWPRIPGVNFNGLANEIGLLDFGPEYDARWNTGVLREPPVMTGKRYTTLVPKVDADGNDLAGVRSTTIQAPLGTYSGWNLRRAGFAEGDSCGLQGSFIPFAGTLAERKQSGDPRASLTERYVSQEGYVVAVKKAAAALQAERLLLDEDAARLIAEAEQAPVLAGK